MAVEKPRWRVAAEAAPNAEQGKAWLEMNGPPSCTITADASNARFQLVYRHLGRSTRRSVSWPVRGMEAAVEMAFDALWDLHFRATGRSWDAP